MNIQPVTFAGCFGWLHEARAGALGVVMCASAEYEAAATRQSWRVLADRLAEAGLPTLRYDYPGTGDSLGSTEAPGSFDAALASIVAACETLRATAGVTRVALVGARLGAALALKAAETLEVDAVVAIRPVLRGKGYIAEQRALSRIIQTREGAHVRRDPDPGAIEIEGFRLSPDSVERITQIDLAAASARAPRRVLIFGEPRSAQYDALAAKLAARGASVDRQDLREVAGWAPAPIPVPPPLDDCDAIAAWLAPEPRETARRRVDDSGFVTPTFVETAMQFGSERNLAGILCRPLDAMPDKAKRAVIFLNTGANSHIGAGRSAVVQARALASAGVASLRMDIVGLGDAAWTLEGPLSAIHHHERAVDVSAAIDALRGLDFVDITLVGVCSGAFLAFHGALADARVNRILIANPQYWLPLSSEELADPMQAAVGSTKAYVGKALNSATWRRALSGEIQMATLIGIARVVTNRIAEKAIASLERAGAKALGRPLGQRKLIGLARKLTARGCRVRLILSENDPAIGALAALLPGGDFSALEGYMDLTFAAGADHAFVMKRTREEFFGVLMSVLGATQAKPKRAIAA